MVRCRPVNDIVQCTRTLYISVSIPDPGFRGKKISDPGSGSASRSLSIFNSKKLLVNFRKYDPECSSRLRILIFSPSRIRRSKWRGIPDPDPQHWYILVQISSSFSGTRLLQSSLSLFSSDRRSQSCTTVRALHFCCKLK